MLSHCFANQKIFQEELYQLALEAILPFCNKEAIRPNAEMALVSLGIVANNNVRKEIINYFRKKNDCYYLALLNEPLTEIEIRTFIQEVSQANYPVSSTNISFGGIRVTTFNAFNEILPPTLYNFVIDHLLNIIKNDYGLAYQKSEAIVTLGRLPIEVLLGRLDEIASFLIDRLNGALSKDGSAKEDVPNTDLFFTKFSGMVSEIYRSSLYTLGLLYRHVSEKNKNLIKKAVIFSSHQEETNQRLGSAMFLRVFESNKVLSDELKFILVELLKDDEIDIRHWAASAAGHLVTQGNLKGFAQKYIIERLMAMAETEENARARAGIAYGLRLIAESKHLDAVSYQKVVGSVNQLKTDVNYRVRYLAGQKEGD